MPEVVSIEKLNRVGALQLKIVYECNNSWVRANQIHYPTIFEDLENMIKTTLTDFAQACAENNIRRIAEPLVKVEFGSQLELVPKPKVTVTILGDTK